jgi:hypothetical protein
MAGFVVVASFSSKGGRLSLLMSTRGLEGVEVRNDKFSGVMWTPAGEKVLSSENNLDPPYEGESFILTSEPDLAGKLRGYEDTYECFWGVGVRGVNVSEEGITVAGGATWETGVGVPAGRANVGSGAPTGGEDMDVVAVAKVGCVPNPMVEEDIKLGVVAAKELKRVDGAVAVEVVLNRGVGMVEAEGLNMLGVAVVAVGREKGEAEVEEVPNGFAVVVAVVAGVVPNSVVEGVVVVPPKGFVEAAVLPKGVVPVVAGVEVANVEEKLGVAVPPNGLEVVVPKGLAVGVVPKGLAVVVDWVNPPKVVVGAVVGVVVPKDGVKLGNAEVVVPPKGVGLVVDGVAPKVVPKAGVVVVEVVVAGAPNGLVEGVEGNPNALVVDGVVPNGEAAGVVVPNGDEVAVAPAESAGEELFFFPA